MRTFTIALDMGYDSMIERLVAHGIQANAGVLCTVRCADVGNIPIIRTAGTISVDDKLSINLEYLHRRGE